MYTYKTINNKSASNVCVYDLRSFIFERRSEKVISYDNSFFISLFCVRTLLKDVGSL